MTKPSLGDAFRKQKQDAAEAARAAERAQKAAELQQQDARNTQRLHDYLTLGLATLKQSLDDAGKSLAAGKEPAPFKNPEALEFYHAGTRGGLWSLQDSLKQAIENHPAAKKLHALCRKSNIALSIATGYVAEYEGHDGRDPDMQGYGRHPAYVAIKLSVDFDKPYQAPAKPAAKQKGIVPRR